MSLTALLQEVTKSQSDELERVINTERVNLVTLKNNHQLAIDRHKLELNQLITWATELNGDRVRETDAEYAKLITAAEDRIARLTTLNGSVFEGTVLKVAPEHEEPTHPPSGEATLPTSDLGTLMVDGRDEAPAAMFDAVDLDKIPPIDDILPPRSRVNWPLRRRMAVENGSET